MAIKAISLTDEKVIESEFDDAKGTDAATKFAIRALDSMALGYVLGKATKGSDKDGADTVSQIDATFEAVAFGLKGWTNFKDEQGNDVPFKQVLRVLGTRKYQVASPEVLGLIPLPVVNEIANAVIGFSKLTETEAKN